MIKSWSIFFFIEKASLNLEIPGESGGHQRPGLNNVPLAGPCPGTYRIIDKQTDDKQTYYGEGGYIGLFSVH